MKILESEINYFRKKKKTKYLFEIFFKNKLQRNEIYDSN